MISEWLQYVPVVADWMSIVSLFVSGYAAYAITKVRTQVVDRVRLPTLVGVLEKHGKRFASLMLTYDDNGGEEAFGLELARCEANLRLVKGKLSRTRGNRASIVLREIVKYKRPRMFGYYEAVKTREQAWKIYAELNGLIEELKNVVEENRMGV